MQSPDGWTLAPDIPGEYGDRTWLVTDHEPVRYDIDRRRAASFRQDVAAVLDVSSSTLLLQPVWPRILNFRCDHGLLIRSVLLAVEAPASAADDPVRRIVCLSGPSAHLAWLCCRTCSGRSYDVTALATRLQDFCPAGFRIAVAGGHPRQNEALDRRTIFAGEVLTVSFVPELSPSLQSGGPLLVLRLGQGEPIRPSAPSHAPEARPSAAGGGSQPSGFLPWWTYCRGAPTAHHQHGPITPAPDHVRRCGGRHAPYSCFGMPCVALPASARCAAVAAC